MGTKRSSRLSPPFPWIVAHRGDHGTLPENTIPAFDAALEAGADGFEFDVQLASDDVPVVWHDRTLSRIGGGRRRARDLTAAAFGRLNAAILSTGARKKVRPPTLRQILERYGGRTQLFIEIKSRPRDRRENLHLSLARRVVDEVEKARLHSTSFHILSFDREVLEETRRLRPSCRLVLNVERLSFPREAREVGRIPLSGCCIPVHRLTPATGSAIRARGLSVMTYACNMAYQVRRALAAGADVIMSDRPYEARRFLAGRRSRKPSDG